MKKLLQFVALAVSVILTAQPALAGPSCGQRLHNAAGDACCVSMTNSDMQTMRASCSAAMPTMVASSGCNDGDCCQISSVSTPQVVPPTKSKADGAALSLPIDQITAVSTSILPLHQ